MASTLREELASLKIERPNSIKARSNGQSKPSPRRGRWRIAVDLVDSVDDSAGAIGRRGNICLSPVRSDAVPSGGKDRPRLGDDLGGGVDLARCERLLKSRYQAMIGTKLAGRVEQM